MLRYVVIHLARVLLHRHCPERAQLGLKTIEKSLPEPILEQFKETLKYMTPSKHHSSIRLLTSLVDSEKDWIYKTLKEED